MDEKLWLWCFDDDLDALFSPEDSLAGFLISYGLKTGEELGLLSTGLIFPPPLDFVEELWLNGDTEELPLFGR